MKSLFFFASLCASMHLLPMEESKIDFRDVPSCASVKDHFRQMFKTCTNKCSFSNDVLTRCSNSCIQDLLRRSDGWVVRKYTLSCQGLPSTEKFNFDPTAEELERESTDTREAYLALANESIARCVRAKVNEHGRRVDFAWRVLELQDKRMREEHPLQTALVDLENKIRRRN